MTNYPQKTGLYIYIYSYALWNLVRLCQLNWIYQIELYDVTSIEKFNNLIRLLRENNLIYFLSIWYFLDIGMWLKTIKLIWYCTLDPLLTSRTSSFSAPFRMPNSAQKMKKPKVRFQEKVLIIHILSARLFIVSELL